MLAARRYTHAQSPGYLGHSFPFFQIYRAGQRAAALESAPCLLLPPVHPLSVLAFPTHADGCAATTLARYSHLLARMQIGVRAEDGRCGS